MALMGAAVGAAGGAAPGYFLNSPTLVAAGAIIGGSVGAIFGYAKMFGRYSAWENSISEYIENGGERR